MFDFIVYATGWLAWVFILGVCATYWPVATIGALLAYLALEIFIQWKRAK